MADEQLALDTADPDKVMQVLRRAPGPIRRAHRWPGPAAFRWFNELADALGEPDDLKYAAWKRKAGL